MSPEPTQEPLEENLNPSDLPRDAGREGSDSDSEDEDATLAGYVPLSQIPTNTDPILDDDDVDSRIDNTSESARSLPVPQTGSSHHECSPETLEVWSKPRNQSNIDLDPEKINQVKSMMATFTLPATAFPEWANTISEEQWKEQLMRRIKEIQSRDK